MLFLQYNVDKKEKVKIADITFVGNEYFRSFKASQADERYQGEKPELFQSFKIYSVKNMMRIRIS